MWHCAHSNLGPAPRKKNLDAAFPRCCCKAGQCKTIAMHSCMMRCGIKLETSWPNCAFCSVNLSTCALSFFFRAFSTRDSSVRMDKMCASATVAAALACNPCHLDVSMSISKPLSTAATHQQPVTQHPPSKHKMPSAPKPRTLRSTHRPSQDNF